MITEVLPTIFSFLSYQEVIVSCSIVCKNWNRASKDDLLWKIYIGSYFEKEPHQVFKQNIYVQLKNQAVEMQKNYRRSIIDLFGLILFLSLPEVVDSSQDLEKIQPTARVMRGKKVIEEKLIYFLLFRYSIFYTNNNPSSGESKFYYYQKDNTEEENSYRWENVPNALSLHQIQRLIKGETIKLLLGKEMCLK